MSSLMKEIVAVIHWNPDNLAEEEKGNFCMKELCEEVMGMMESKMEERKIEYVLEVEEELSGVRVSVERNVVKQILMNLSANALLNMGRGELKIGWKFSEDDKSLIKVSIHDEGKSIGFEEARKINKILSGKPTNQEAEKLEGSNLHISKVLVDKLGGKIWIVSENEIGNSSNFTFRIENDDCDFSFDEELEISDYNSQKDGVKLVPSMNWNEAPFTPIEPEQSENENCWSNILLVDDNYFNIEVLQSLIEVQLQLSWDSAFNGEEACHKVTDRYKQTCWSKHYKFIFMDVNMPIMDGYAASAEIKRFLKKQAVLEGRDFTKIPTKIFAVTAQKEVIENEQKLFDGIILKPISIDGLRNVLK